LVTDASTHRYGAELKLSDWKSNYDAASKALTEMTPTLTSEMSTTPTKAARESDAEPEEEGKGDEPVNEENGDEDAVTAETSEAQPQDVDVEISPEVRLQALKVTFAVLYYSLDCLPPSKTKSLISM
jgi:hypothetical protein